MLSNPFTFAPCVSLPQLDRGKDTLTIETLNLVSLELSFILFIVFRYLFFLSIMAPTIGGMAPPLGTSPNFVDPYSLQKYNVITQAVCFTSSTIFVSARLFTKIRLIPPLRSEDCTNLRKGRILGPLD